MAVVLLSGGLDSYVVAHMVRKDVEKAVFVRYGQQAELMENIAAERITEELDLPLEVIDVSLPESVTSKCALINSDMFLHEELEKTKCGFDCYGYVVPFRNNIFIAMAALCNASSLDNRIFVGFDYNDQQHCKDCSPRFVAAQNMALAESDQFDRTGGAVVAPLNEMTKKDILRYAVDNRLSIENTWGCYNCVPKKGSFGYAQCGVCMPCWRKRQVFKEMRFISPIKYATLAELISEMGMELWSKFSNEWKDLYLTDNQKKDLPNG